jgi:hypothetical protein
MKKYTIYLIAALILVFGLSTGLALAASMSDYCVLPPYVKRNVRPNIMIILDNSEVNGAPAYTATSDPESITDGLTGFLLYNAATQDDYAGLHNPALWYYYSGNRFDPADPNDITDPNRDQAVFEGNLLNWLTTSRYDLIQSVLVGGKSASRVANPHTLVGYNASDPNDSAPLDPAWDKRIYVYVGEDTNTYACEFIINDADKGDLTITDSGAYFSTFGYTCGLILPTPVRPSTPRRIASAETTEETLVAALNQANDISPAAGEPGPLMRGFYRLINKLFSIGASPAYAVKPIGLDNKSLTGVPDATRFQSYSGHQFFATGGMGSYSWEVTGAPAGIDIDDSGYLSGWPTDVPKMTYTLTIKVTDQDSPPKSDSANVDIYLYGSIVSMVSPTDGGTLTDVVRFEPYSFQAIATGGTGSYTWSITAGALPPGLTLNNATGLISGTTTDWPGSMYNLTLQVDDGYETATAAVSITVQGQWFQVSAPMVDLPEGKQNDPYVGYTCEAQGGSGSYTWSVDPGDPLPPGLSIDPATGYISGTPTMPGSFMVHIIATDDVSGETRDAWPFLFIRGGLITWPNDGFNMGDTIFGMPYVNRFQPVAQGGTGSYTWGAIGLPVGLIINSTTGIINGTTTDIVGSWIEFTITVDDGMTGDSVRASMYVMNPQAIDIVWPWNLGALPSAVEGQPYQGASPATFYGDGQNTWSAVGLPPGLSMAPDSGLITGTPTAPGSYDVTLTVTQQDMVTTDTVTNVRLEVLPVGAPVIIKPENGFWLPDGYEGISYSYTCEATGGSGAFTWSVDILNPLPAGLSIDPATGLISGFPGAGTTGAYMVDVTVDDGVWTDTATVNFWINSSGVVSITAPPDLGDLPIAYEGDPYGGYSPAATGGTGRYTWSAVGLPAGLSIDPATGFISGSAGVGTGGDPLPTNYTVTITVDDGLGTDSVTVTLGVLDVAGLNAATFSVRACATEPGIIGYTVNFWDQGWYGLIDFDNAGDPAYNCLPQTTQESFFTAVENATPVGVITKLIDGEYIGTRVYDPDIPPSEKLSACTDPFDPGAHASTPEYPTGMDCRKNFILMLTAGEGAATGSKVFDGAPWPPLASPCDTLTDDIAKNACYAYENDLRSGVDGKQNVATYIVNMMGENEAILRPAAEDAGGGKYYGVESPALISAKIKEALQDIIKRAASGTAASVLASGEGSGANLIQAVYYPVKRFDDSASNDYDEARWVGRLSNFWFYVDPFFQNNSIRENTVQEIPPTLDLTTDLIAELYFNPTLEKVQADLFTDTDGDGDADDIRPLPVPDGIVNSIGDAGAIVDDAYTKDFESVKSLWEAGMKLWERDIVSDPRTIYANIENTTVMTPLDLSLISNATVQNLMNVTDEWAPAGVDDETQILINYLHGFDYLGNDEIRDRTVRFVDLNKDGDTEDAGEDTPRVWKLGDVINSTPSVSSWIPLNIYDKPPYVDSTYQEFVNSATYVNRGMVFAGGNDGMLHAFNLGKLELNWIGQGAHEKARLTGANLGREEWAFIPHNALPYLMYQLEPGYCHVYTVDLSPYIFDASFAVDPDVNNDAIPDQPGECALGSENCLKSSESWRTVLIGGMRYGGACKDETVTCDNTNTVDTNLDGSIDDADCVKTPVSGVGYSSYFALDITDQSSPQLLWEFSHPDLGFATTGPAIVRICGKADHDSNPVTPLQTDCTRNGKWVAVVGSGPTGPINIGSTQFLANSDQNLRLFMIDVADGTLLETIDTGVPYAFAGSMLNITNDSDLDYQDEALYIGYVKRDTTPDPDTWTQGGVGRLLTGENPDPTTWKWSVVIDDVGPMASAITRLQNNLTNELWLFFGSGRYFYEDAGGADDAAGTRHLVGLTEPCFQTPANPFDVNCTTSVNYADLADVTAISAGSNDPDGWYIELDPQDPATGSFEAERVITDPLSSSSGIVFYTTFKPYKDVCSIGGKSHIWAVQYASGGAAGALLKGTALIQVSTGSIEKIDLGSAFTEKGGRRTSAMEGVPPIAQGFSIFKTPPPVERMIHMIEK